MTDIVTYCDVNTCEDCPRYGDDCDGDKRVEHTDLISRADAIEAVRKEYEDAINIGDNGDAIAYDVGRILSALPSAKYVTEKPNDAVKASNDVINRADAIEAVAIAICKDYDEIYALKALPSAEAVQIHNDGTLEVKVANAQKVGRVLVMDTDSHIGGGLFYPDDAVEVVRCKDCKHKYVSGNGTTQYYVCDFMDAQYEENGFCHHAGREIKE